MGFVLFNTINFSRPIQSDQKLNDMSRLVHEMVHVAQYRNLWIQYIFEALILPYIGGYKYGNVSSLNSSSWSY